MRGIGSRPPSNQDRVDWLPDGRLLLSIESPADGLRGWYLAGRSGERLGRVDVLPVEVCCGEGQVAY